MLAPLTRFFVCMGFCKFLIRASEQMCHLPPFLCLSSAPLLYNSVLILSITGLLTCFPSWPLHVPLSLLLYFTIFPALTLLSSLWAWKPDDAVQPKSHRTPLALALLCSSGQPQHNQGMLLFLHEEYHAPSSLGKM